MGLIDFPDPVSMFEGAKNAGLEREVVNTLASSAYSSWISLMWRAGTARAIVWLGLGAALKDAATSAYLSLRELEKKNFLVLTVPQDLLTADNLSRFQTEQMTK
jgi:hypothetical protein